MPLGTDNSTVVGVGSEFLDNVYVVNNVEVETQVIAGVSTSVTKVTVNTDINPNWSFWILNRSIPWRILLG